MDQIYLILSIIAAATVILGFIVKRLWPGVRALFRLLDQLTGVPENKRLNRKAEPGLFEILAHQNETLAHQNATLENQDASIEEMKGTLAVIRHEVEFNNGSSVKDAVIRVENKLNEHLVPPTPTTTINVNGGTTP
jgi:hypothetical protein